MPRTLHRLSTRKIETLRSLAEDPENGQRRVCDDTVEKVVFESGVWVDLAQGRLPLTLDWAPFSRVCAGFAPWPPSGTRLLHRLDLGDAGDRV